MNPFSGLGDEWGGFNATDWHLIAKLVHLLRQTFTGVHGAEALQRRAGADEFEVGGAHRLLAAIRTFDLLVAVVRGTHAAALTDFHTFGDLRRRDFHRHEARDAGVDHVRPHGQHDAI